MTYALGARSLANLVGVNPDLAAIIEKAIVISAVDFGVPAKAVRTLDEQKALLAEGLTKTLKSKHLVHTDGKGWAADLVPYVGGAYVWEDPAHKGEPHPAFFEIASAMRYAAGPTMITWGAVWDRVMRELGPDLSASVAAYNRRHPGPDFNDYPHFQLGRN